MDRWGRDWGGVSRAVPWQRIIKAKLMSKKRK
jgi:hypothetical protein